MAEPYPYYAVYELHGSAADAAKQLVALEKDIYQRRVPEGSRRVVSPRDGALLRREVADEIRKKRPDLVEKTGLDVPAVLVERLEATGYPRAYNQYPHIGMIDPEGRIFMFCPLDYKGEHYVPEDGVQVDDGDLYTTDFGDMIYRRQGAFSPPLLAREKSGTKLPADFDAAKHRFRDREPENHALKVFIAAGSSLACVQDFLKRKEDLTNAKKKVQQKVEELASELDGKATLGAKEGDDIAVRCYFKPDAAGKTEVWLELKNKSRGNDAVILKDNAHFLTEDYSHGAFRIMPNRATPEGQKLGRLFDNLTSEPKLEQYWQLWNPTAPSLTDKFNGKPIETRTPTIDTVRGVHYLVYKVDPDAAKDHCCPPGGIPVNAAEYLWMKADQQDEESFVRQPEPPAALAHMRPIRVNKPAP